MNLNPLFTGVSSFRSEDEGGELKLFQLCSIILVRRGDTSLCPIFDYGLRCTGGSSIHYRQSILFSPRLATTIRGWKNSIHLGFYRLITIYIVL